MQNARLGESQTGIKIARRNIKNLSYADAAAAAKSLQLCPTLCYPRDGSPSGAPTPGILQVRTLEWVAISFSNAWKWKVKVKSLSHVQPSATPWNTAFQAPLSMGFSRQEYWSEVPLPSLVCRWYHSYSRKWRGTKGPLDRGQRGEWKADLKLNIQKSKIMASSPLNSWQRDGKKIGNSDRFYFLGLQNYCEQWLQPQNWKMLAPWKKSYDKTLLLFFSD